MVKLYTPELNSRRDDLYGIPAEMVSPNDATEDEDLYVRYADYKLLEARGKLLTPLGTIV